LYESSRTPLCSGIDQTHFWIIFLGIKFQESPSKNNCLEIIPL
jgi:hypothetical protein